MRGAPPLAFCAVTGAGGRASSIFSGGFSTGSGTIAGVSSGGCSSFTSSDGFSSFFSSGSGFRFDHRLRRRRNVALDRVGRRLDRRKLDGHDRGVIADLVRLMPLQVKGDGAGMDAEHQGARHRPANKVARVLVLKPRQRKHAHFASRISSPTSATLR